jgi:hypothetical protein
MPNTVVATLTYSRQFKKTHERTIQLLKELENELELNGLSLMRETEHIMDRVNNATNIPKKHYKFTKNPS